MEAVKVESAKVAPKSKSKVGTDSLRVRKETKKKIKSDLLILNKKEFGKPVTPDQYVALAIGLLKPEHLQKLQEQSLTGKDKFDQKFKDHLAQGGKLSKDEFLATLLE